MKPGRRTRLLLVIPFALLLAFSLFILDRFKPGWWIRDPERAARMAWRAHQRKDFLRAHQLWRKAVALRPDWCVGYSGLAETAQQQISIGGMTNTFPAWIPKFLRSRLEKSAARAFGRLFATRDGAGEHAAKLCARPEFVFSVWKAKPKAGEWLVRAFENYRTGKWKQASEAFRSALVLAPNLKIARVFRAECLSLLGESRQAIAELMKIGNPSSLAYTEDFGLLRRVYGRAKRAEGLPHREPEFRRLRVDNWIFLRGKWRRTLGSYNPVDSYKEEVSVIAANRGRLWLAHRVEMLESDNEQSHDRAAWTFDGANWNRIRLSGSDDPSSITLVAHNEVWIGTGYGGHGGPLFRLIGNGVQHATPVFDAGNPNLYLRVLRNHYGLWIVADNEVYRKTGRVWLVYHSHSTDGGKQWPVQKLVGFRKPPKDEREYWPFAIPVWKDIYSKSGLKGIDPDLAQDRYGRLWCQRRLFNGRFFQEATGRIAHWRTKAITDATAILWGEDEILGGRGSDFHGKAWHNDVFTFRDYDGSPVLPEQVIAIDHKRRLWVGATGIGLVLWDGTRWHYFTEDDGLLSNNITCMASDGGVLWIGSDRGVSRVTLP